jgi:hypothetical protein
MKRRDFFLFGSGRTRTLEVSCEQLYMSFVDARMDGSADALIARLRQASTRAWRLRLRKTSWLAQDDFRAMLTPWIDDFSARGGTVVISSEPVGCQESAEEIPAEREL